MDLGHQPQPTTLLNLLLVTHFPADITADLISNDNPMGTIANSDFKLSGTVAHQDVLVQHHNCNHCTVHVLHDNVLAVSWQKKGSTTTTGPAACLLGISALHQCHHHCLALIDHMPRVTNATANDFSRLWHSTNSQLLTHLNSLCPQKQPWHIVHL